MLSTRSLPPSPWWLLHPQHHQTESSEKALCYALSRFGWFCEVLTVSLVWLKAARLVLKLWELTVISFSSVDHTRVVLHDGDPNEPVSDYINANIIMVSLTFTVFSGLMLLVSLYLWHHLSKIWRLFLISSLNLKPSATIQNPKRATLLLKAACRTRWMISGGWCSKRTLASSSWPQRRWREGRYALCPQHLIKCS